MLNNRKLIHDQLGLKSEDILCDNPYFQRKTVKQRGCQIDYLIQAKYKTLYLCEIKFLRKPIDVSVIQSVKEKIEKMVLPRGFACLPVLVHAGEVSDAVVAADFFLRLLILII